MSLTSRRNGTGRIYVRSFDHDEALARLRAGERADALAVEYGVSKSMIYKLSPDSKRRDQERQKRWRTGTCESCGGRAMRLVSAKIPHNPDGRTLCYDCRNKEKRTRFTIAGGRLYAVCFGGCGESKPLDEFPAGVRYKDIRPNGIHTQCRSCNTKAKREYRATHPEYRRTNGGHVA